MYGLLGQLYTGYVAQARERDGVRKPSDGRIAHDGVRTSDRQRRDNHLGGPNPYLAGTEQRLKRKL